MSMILIINSFYTNTFLVIFNSMDTRNSKDASRDARHGTKDNNSVDASNSRNVNNSRELFQTILKKFRKFLFAQEQNIDLLLYPEFLQLKPVPTCPIAPGFIKDGLKLFVVSKKRNKSKQNKSVWPNNFEY
jgi:hypothetical protein